jgi:hypothetical protein
MKLARHAVHCGNAQEESLTLLRLAHGNDMAIRKPPSAKPQIDATIFNAHFESLFTKHSEKETLGFNETNAGPKVPPKTELSGAPTLAEVQKAIKGLSRGTAPGSNGLRPELFKHGGDALAKRIVSDFGALWPREEEMVLAHPLPPKAEILQTWQDADFVTLFKMKGDPTDPGNYRGIFLLTVAGKVLASVIDERLKTLIEGSVNDAQCGFRRNRSTSHLIHILRRTQEACHKQGTKAYVVFIDFAKAFDSPPRGAIWKCLNWSGCPPDLLAVIMAIHADPRGRLCGNTAFFRVTRGVRQGCVLGPTLFIIVLEYCFRLTGPEGTGVKFRCVPKGGLSVPPDLHKLEFSAGSGIYADDAALYGTDPVGFSRALTRLQAVSGSIGLDVSVKMTEWLYLNNPDKTELNKCKEHRLPGPCC